jgi:hypothetical protein
MKRRKKNGTGNAKQKLERRLLELELKLHEEALNLDKNRKTTYIE